MNHLANYGGYHPPFNDTHYVYLLECGNNSLYVGCTSNLEERLNRHSHGWVESTKSRLPVKLKMYMVFSNRHEAFKFEKYLKSGSGRAFAKRHLIHGELP
jgi:predicted GIY-YIG superfamily endonuclease